ncbi:hypothetical protein [Actinoplanes flavus]|uniref:Uncharacterized protein n=1 Tax=Actinoplanes flavus TaxID=2820290 RepID=A0ABS3URK0_9ACTN|nr:hypothetical protein [Actinoplanes flavus]MBO3741191.1 hypothetical protein [Actinoplanes flavus]
MGPIDRGGRGGSGPAQALSVTLTKAPCSMPLMLAAEILSGLRIVSARAAITHPRQLFRGEHLELAHT